MRLKISWLKLNKVSYKFKALFLNCILTNFLFVLQCQQIGEDMKSKKNNAPAPGYIKIGKTNVRVEEACSTTNRKCKVITKQKVGKVLVECEYCEAGKSSMDYSFRIAIKLYNNNSVPKYVYEIYANTANPKYNQQIVCSKYDDVTIVEGGYGYEVFVNTLDFINTRFEPITKNCIASAKMISENQHAIDQTPNFIAGIIDEYKYTMENVITK